MTAGDKATGRSGNVTISNDRGRLTQEEINRMLHEAELFASYDAKVKARAEAKVKLESYAFQVRGLNEHSEGGKLWY